MGESIKASSGFLWASGKKALRAQTFIAFVTFSLQRAQPHLQSNRHAGLESHNCHPCPAMSEDRSTGTAITVPETLCN